MARDGPADPLAQGRGVEAGAGVTNATSTAPSSVRSASTAASDLGIGGQRGLCLGRVHPKPRTLTSSSVRPRNSSAPLVSSRTRSPVRYIREAGLVVKGAAQEPAAVAPGGRGKPRANRLPPTKSSPGCPSATASSRLVQDVAGGAGVGEADRQRGGQRPVPAGDRSEGAEGGVLGGP
ncbi:hypothetical protein GCM10020229_50230 [Kitasatospora albolonga]